MKSKICIVIPTYQESENIRSLIEKLNTISKEKKLELGIIVVDDNSPDGTAEIVEKYSTDNENIVLVQRPGKSGLGSATSEGMKKALSYPSCQAVVTMDADFSHDPEDIPRLIIDKCDLAVGSRYVRGGKIEGWGFHRKIISRGANITCRLILRTGVHDNTANFRFYSRRCAEACLEGVTGHDFEWIISILVKAKKQGFKANEVPVKFVNRRQGKSKLKMGHIFKWFQFLIKSIFIK